MSMSQQRLASGKSVEASARTIDEAIQKALSRLGRSADEVEIKVLREPSSGLLGIGGHDAIVRVTERVVPPSLAPQPAIPLPETSRPPVSQPVVSEPLEEARDGGAVAEVTSTPLPVVEAPVAQAPEVSQKAPTLFAARDEDDENFTPGMAGNPELLEKSREILLELLERLQIIADVQARWSDASDPSEAPALILDIVGDDLGMLIGRRGETLRDLQYIVRLLVGRKIGGWANIVVDVEGYKQRREMTLRRMARQVADRVAMSRRPVFMEPMAAYERRIVHLELRNHPQVSTQSSGEGERRKVGVFPR